MVRSHPAAEPLPAPPADAASVAILRLTLTDFRCYARLRLETDPRPVVLAGPNGAGKTNLLEALSLLVPGRGLRGARLGDLARAGGPPSSERIAGGTPAGGRAGRAWAVAGRVVTPRGEVEIGTGRDEDAARDGRERRRIRIDGAPARNQAALAEVLNVIWLVPQMDRLFTDGPAPRRRFLDRLVFGFDPAHAGRVAAYEHALRERAHLLRSGVRSDPAWLTALEDALATKGVAVAAARIEAARRLDAAGRDVHGPFPGFRLEATGEVEGWLAEDPALDVEDRVREHLARSRPVDAETGGAAVGPHRGDVCVRHAAKDTLAELCSTGEQKALLVAIVLAHGRLLGGARGSLPLLLLDEVAAHLDTRRRAALFDEIGTLGAQAWLTGTDLELFRPLAAQAQVFRVEDATVTPL